MPENIKDTNIRNAAKALINDNKDEAINFLDNVSYMKPSLIEKVLKLEYTELGGRTGNAMFRDFLARYFHYNRDGIRLIQNSMADIDKAANF